MLMRKWAVRQNDNDFDAELPVCFLTLTWTFKYNHSTEEDLQYWRFKTGSTLLTFWEKSYISKGVSDKLRMREKRLFFLFWMEAGNRGKG